MNSSSDTKDGLQHYSRVNHFSSNPSSILENQRFHWGPLCTRCSTVIRNSSCPSALPPSETTVPSHYLCSDDPCFLEKTFQNCMLALASACLLVLLCQIRGARIRNFRSQKLDCFRYNIVTLLAIIAHLCRRFLLEFVTGFRDYPPWIPLTGRCHQMANLPVFVSDMAAAPVNNSTFAHDWTVETERLLGCSG